MSGATKLMTAGGGGVNIQPASSIASDVTVNVPSQNCTLGIQGPAFSAYGANNQGMSSATWTKLIIDTEEFDTASCFDSTTNYRFTPNVAGYYQINAAVRSTDSSICTETSLGIYKNGAAYKRGGTILSVGSISTSCVVYLNGSTDYVEMYAYIVASSTVANGGSQARYFNGALVRAA